MFTQGKWEIIKVGYPKDSEYWVTNNQNVVAKIGNTAIDENAEDNARLIAAAPELLEACKAALVELSGINNGTECKLLSQAIAKAENV